MLPEKKRNPGHRLFPGLNLLYVTFFAQTIAYMSSNQLLGPPGMNRAGHSVKSQLSAINTTRTSTHRRRAKAQHLGLLGTSRHQKEGRGPVSVTQLEASAALGRPVDRSID